MRARQLGDAAATAGSLGGHAGAGILSRPVLLQLASPAGASNACCRLSRPCGAWPTVRPSSCCSNSLHPHPASMHLASSPQPEPEEDPREAPEDHGHVSVEHILQGAPLIPHETLGAPPARAEWSGWSDGLVGRRGAAWCPCVSSRPTGCPSPRASPPTCCDAPRLACRGAARGGGRRLGGGLPRCQRAACSRDWAAPSPTARPCPHSGLVHSLPPACVMLLPVHVIQWVACESPGSGMAEFLRRGTPQLLRRRRRGGASAVCITQQRLRQPDRLLQARKRTLRAHSRLSLHLRTVPPLPPSLPTSRCATPLWASRHVHYSRGRLASRQGARVGACSGRALSSQLRHATPPIIALGTPHARALTARRLH